jgi:hypothetical protein
MSRNTAVAVDAIMIHVPAIVAHVAVILIKVPPVLAHIVLSNGEQRACNYENG